MLLVKKFWVVVLCGMMLCPRSTNALERCGALYNSVRIVAATSLCAWYILYKYNVDLQKSCFSRIINALAVLNLTFDIIGE